MTDSEAGLSDDAIQFAHTLLDAARGGDVALVTSAVDQGVPADLCDERGNTFLMLAAYHGHANLVAALADRGADVNRQNDRGQTPLAGAVFKRDAAVIALLVERGADLDAGSPSARDTAAMFDVSLDTAAGSAPQGDEG